MPDLPRLAGWLSAQIGRRGKLEGNLAPLSSLQMFSLGNNLPAWMDTVRGTDGWNCSRKKRKAVNERACTRCLACKKQSNTVEWQQGGSLMIWNKLLEVLSVL